MSRQIAQKLVLFRHAAQGLFYIMECDYADPKKFEIYSSIARCVGKAKNLYGNTGKTDRDSRGLSSGFMIALVNTDYMGWTREVLAEVYANADESSKAKQQAVLNELETTNFAFAGARLNGFVKGTAGEGLKEATWHKPFPRNMDQAAISRKIDFICRSLPHTLPATLRHNAYMAMAVDNHSANPRNMGFGDYEIKNFGTLLRYVRNYIGLDLPVTQVSTPLAMAA